MDKLTSDILGVTAGVSAASNLTRAMKLTKKPTTKNMLKGLTDLSIGTSMTKAIADSIK